MKFAYFPGCSIPGRLPEYGHAVERACRALGIELIPLEFNCCGYPVRHENLLASAYSGLRNLSLAAEAGLPILTPCKCCLGNLKFAPHQLASNEFLAGRVHDLLVADRLNPSPSTQVYHLLTVLDRHVTPDRLRSMVKHPLSMKLACHYGCHALRPGEVAEFDDPLAPTVFERIITALGATPVNWDLRLECCGYPLRGRDDTISQALMRKKLENARNSGADAVVTACTYCQLQFDTERGKLPGADLLHSAPPSLLVTTLLERALGIEQPETTS